MLFSFSKELITRAQIYYSTKHSRDISREEAAELLNALADLYGIYAALGEARDARFSARPASDLINTHNCNV